MLLRCQLPESGCRGLGKHKGCLLLKCVAFTGHSPHFNMNLNGASSDERSTSHIILTPGGNTLSRSEQNLGQTELYGSTEKATTPTLPHPDWYLLIMGDPLPQSS